MRNTGGTTCSAGAVWYDKRCIRQRAMAVMWALTAPLTSQRPSSCFLCFVSISSTVALTLCRAACSKQRNHKGQHHCQHGTSANFLTGSASTMLDVHSGMRAGLFWQLESSTCCDRCDQRTSSSPPLLGSSDTTTARSASASLCSLSEASSAATLDELACMGTRINSDIETPSA